MTRPSLIARLVLPTAKGGDAMAHARELYASPPRFGDIKRALSYGIFTSQNPTVTRL